MAERPWFLDLAFALASGLLLGWLLHYWGLGAFLVGLALRIVLSVRFGKVG